MKTVQNPTQYFFEQANNPPTEYLDKINEFVTKLLNCKQCLLCRNDFNLKERLPRILIHCGHTICHSCLLNFFRNRRVRCPLCLKLVKHIDDIDRLPVNHTIFTKIANEINQKSKLHGGTDILKPQEYLYQQFNEKAIKSQKQSKAKGQQATDPETGLELCQYHEDRVKHFFCLKHKETQCRACVEALHNKPDCKVVDLYEIDDIPSFLADQLQSQLTQNQEAGMVINNKNDEALLLNSDNENENQEYNDDKNFNYEDSDDGEENGDAKSL